PLIKEALDHVDRFSMIQEADATRIQRLGASKDRIEVNGNAKYDLLLTQASVSLKEEIEAQLCLRRNQPVFLAGSTRGAEDRIILEVYQKIRQSIPEALLIIAPRHISKTPDIEKSVREKGFEYQLRTQIGEPGVNRTAPVLIINTIGELQALYSVASLVFCGGSLEPLGGQNVLEAAVWGKPVLYGPSMTDFLDAKSLLEKTGGGIQIKDGADLAEKAIYYLSNPPEAERVGRLAKKAVLSNTGAADKHAAVIWELLR
ncbi:MAG: glycosyltransferase N-terminal domain-containing protein, partial [Desulfobacterales bacterium]